MAAGAGSSGGRCGRASGSSGPRAAGAGSSRWDPACGTGGSGGGAAGAGSCGASFASAEGGCDDGRPELALRGRAAAGRLAGRVPARPWSDRRGWAGPGPWAGAARRPSGPQVRVGPVAAVPPPGAARVGWVAERMGRWVAWVGPAVRDGRRSRGAPGAGAGWRLVARERVPARKRSEATPTEPAGSRVAAEARQRVPRRRGALAIQGHRRLGALAARERGRSGVPGRRAARARAVPAGVWSVERTGNEAGSRGVSGYPRGWIGSGRRGLARPEGRVVAGEGPRVGTGLVRRPGPTLIGRRWEPRLPGSRDRVGGLRGGR